MKTKDLTTCAVGAALIAICSWISIPATVPFTLQTFGICLIAGVFGWKRGLWTVAVYILLGAFGVPVFSGFHGGIAVLFGTTGGYIFGFLLTALIVGIAADRYRSKLWVLALSMVLGIAVCYAFGTVWFIRVYAKNSGPIGVMTALSWCVFPYILPDAVKIAAAVPLVNRLYRVLNKER